MIKSRHFALPLLLFALVGIGLVVFSTDTQNAGKKPASHTSKPSRIVSLAPSNTEILYALGLEKRIVGVTTYCNYPLAAKKKPKVGDMNTNIEKVISLKPDLVVAHGKMNDHLIKRLRSLGMKVAAPDPKSFSQLYADIRNIGKLAGEPSKADAVVKKMSADVSWVKSKTSAAKPKKVLVVIQTNPLWVAGPGVFVDEMLKFSKATNVAHDASPGFNQFSAEVAVTRNPDVIIVSRREDRDFFLKNPLWAKTNAVKDRCVYVVNGDLMLRAGPRLSEGLKEIAKAVHPEVFK